VDSDIRSFTTSTLECIWFGTTVRFHFDGVFPMFMLSLTFIIVQPQFLGFSFNLNPTHNPHHTPFVILGVSSLSLRFVRLKSRIYLLRR